MGKFLRRKTTILSGVGLLTVLAVYLFLASPVYAIQVALVVDTDTVDPLNPLDGNLGTLGGNGTCDLREALEAAAAAATVNECIIPPDPELDDTYLIDLSAFPVDTVIPLVAGLPALSRDGTIIQGDGRVILDGQNLRGIGFNVTGDDVAIFGVTMQRFSNRAIFVNDAANTIIGGPGAQQRNILIRNANGIVVTDVNAQNITIENNYIGVDNTGSASNNGSGITLQGNSSNITITGNVISSNKKYGINISNSDDNIITNNLIGFDVTGSTEEGNRNSGIRVALSDNTTITGNDIGGNRDYGVILNTANNTTIDGNIFGIAPTTLAAAGNGLDGIRTISSLDVTITNNTLANNSRYGVIVSSGRRVEIYTNSIYDNGNRGISRATGSNNNVLYPLLYNAANSGGVTVIEGRVRGDANTTYRLEYYLNTVCDPSGFGEGETPSGEFNITTDATGIADFTQPIPGGPGVGSLLTIIQTAPNSSSSAFSECIPVLLDTLVADFVPVPASGNAPLAVRFNNLSTGYIDTYSWDFGDGSPLNTERNPRHTYTAPGVYVVTLTITGPAGTDTATATVRVLEVPPTSTPVPPLPTVPTEAPTITVTATETLTLVPTITPLPTETATDIPTITPLPTETATDIPTSTPLPTETATDIPTSTPLPTETATDIPTSTPLPTETATDIPTSTPLPTETATLVPTSTPLPPEIDVDKEGDGDSEVSIVVSNVGEGEARDVVLIEELRESVYYIESDPGSPICLENAGLVVCQLGDLAAGEAAETTFILETNGADPESGRTIVTVDGEPSAVVDEPFIIKVGEPAVAAPGAEVTYTIRVINPTTEIAQDIVVTDEMPEAIEILSGESTSGNLVISGQSVRLTQTSLAPGGRITITLFTQVRDDDVFDSIVNTACLSSSSNPDPSCAQMEFLRARGLPGTGESPWWRNWLLLIFAALAGGMLGGFTFWKLRRR